MATPESTPIESTPRRCLVIHKRRPLKVLGTRDHFFRLRKNQYGSAKHWVALAVKPPSAAAKAAKKAKPKAKPKPKAQSGGK